MTRKNDPRLLKNKKKKEPMSRKMKMIIILSAVVIVLAGASFGAIKWLDNENDYVAKIGDEKIWGNEYRIHLRQEKNNVEANYKIKDSLVSEKRDFWKRVDPEQKKSFEELVKQKSLDAIKIQKIKYLKAKAAGDGTLSNEELQEITQKINDKIAETKSSNGLKTIDEATRKFEEEIGGPISALKQYLIEGQIGQKYIKKLGGKLDTKDSVLKTFFSKNTKQLATYQITHITYAAETANSTDTSVMDIKKKADDMLAKIKSGSKLDDLVKTVKDAGEQGQQAGIVYLNELNSADSPKEVIDAAKKAKLGEVKLITSSSGYHIIRVDKLFTTFDQMKKQEWFIGQYKTDEMSNQIKGWITEYDKKFNPNKTKYSSISIMA